MPASSSSVQPLEERMDSLSLKPEVVIGKRKAPPPPVTGKRKAPPPPPSRRTTPGTTPKQIVQKAPSTPSMTPKQIIPTVPSTPSMTPKHAQTIPPKASASQIPPSKVKPKKKKDHRTRYQLGWGKDLKNNVPPEFQVRQATVKDIRKLHEEDAAWLRAKINKFKNQSKPLVVLTHHAPTYRCRGINNRQTNAEEHGDKMYFLSLSKNELN